MRAKINHSINYFLSTIMSNLTFHIYAMNYFTIFLRCGKSFVYLRVDSEKNNNTSSAHYLIVGATNFSQYSPENVVALLPSTLNNRTHWITRRMRLFHGTFVYSSSLVVVRFSGNLKHISFTDRCVNHLARVNKERRKSCIPVRRRLGFTKRCAITCSTWTNLKLSTTECIRYSVYKYRVTIFQCVRVTFNFYISYMRAWEEKLPSRDWRSSVFCRILRLASRIFRASCISETDRIKICSNRIFRVKKSRYQGHVKSIDPGSIWSSTDTNETNKIIICIRPRSDGFAG